MAEEKNELAAAASKIERARQVVETQKQLIVALEKAGGDSAGARAMLEIYETNLRILQGHRDYLKNRRDEG